MYSMLKKTVVTAFALTALTYGTAAMAQPNITVGNGTVQQGGTVSVPVSFENDGSVVGMNFDINYDDSVFPSVDVDADCDTNDMSPGGVTCTNPSPGVITVVIATFPLDVIASTTVGNISFTADAGAPFAVSPLTIENVSLSDSDANAVNVDQLNDGSIEIVDAASVLNVQPASINFGATENGTSSSPQSFTISNDGSDGIDLEVSAVSLASGSDFSISANSCGALPFTLADGDSCTYDAVFSPTAISNFTDTVTVTSDAGQTTNDQVALSGEGTSGPGASLTIDPASYDYGDLLTGESSTQTFTVTNNGDSGSDASIDTITPPAGDFSVTGGSCSAGSTSLSSGASCTIEIEFAPTSDGAQSGDLVVDGTDTVNSTSIDATSSVQGEGVTEPRFASSAGPGSVNLGTTEPGGTLNQDVTITNDGNAPLDASCGTLTDPDGAFTLTPSPADFTGIAAGESESFSLSCTAPDVGSYEATMQCNTNEGVEGQVHDFTFSCSARPLVIPTMQPWGLALLTLLMLAVGGFSIRFFRT